MESIFLTNKKFIMSIFIPLIIILDSIWIIVWNSNTKFIFLTTILVLLLNLPFFIAFGPRIRDTLNQKLLLTDDQITSIKPSDNTIFQWDKIDRIEYHGISFFPLFDTMIIISNGHRIWIDTGTISYREAWKLVVQNVEAHNKRAYIDPRIKKRLNLESEPRNH